MMRRLWPFIFTVCGLWCAGGLLVMLQYGQLSDPMTLAMAAAENFGPLAIATVVWALMRPPNSN
jgi:hypothetical protein